MSWFELVGKHPQISEGCVYDKKQTAKKWRWMAFSLPRNTKTCTTGKETRTPLKPTGRTPTGFQRCSHITGGSLWMAESNRFHGNTCSKNQLPPLQRLNHLKALQPERERNTESERTPYLLSWWQNPLPSITFTAASCAENAQLIRPNTKPAQTLLCADRIHSLSLIPL